MRLITVLIYLVYSFDGFSQNYQYAVKLRGKEIGTIQATATADGDKLIYQVNSNTSVSMLYKLTYTSSIEAIYKSDELQKASSISYQNGKIKDNRKVRKTEAGYSIISAANEETKYKLPIRHSVAQLYFKEPVGVNRTFSETQGAFCNLTNMSNHVYKLEVADGDVNYYHYANGKLQKVIVDRSVYDLEFQLITN